MAYELHIERDEQEISLEEWVSVLESNPYVRQKTDDTVAINPGSGEEIRIGCNDGDAEILVTSGGVFGIGRREEWLPTFRFSNGRASFKATEDIDSPKSPVRIIATQLAVTLNAGIVGDEGEQYGW